MTALVRDGGSRQAGATQAFSIIIANAMPILAPAALVPSLPLMLRHFHDVPNAGFLVPMILTIPTLCLGMLSSIAGALADRFGRRRILLLALGLFALAGVAPLLMDSLYAILIVRLGVGLAEACIPSSGNALLGDYFTADARRRWISLEMVLGPMIGSIMVLAGGLLGTISWRAPFALYAFGLVPLCAILLWTWEPERRNEEFEDAAHTFPWGRAAIVAVGTLVAAIPFFSQNIQHGRIFASLGVGSTAHIAICATIASIGTMVGAYFYRRYRFANVGSALALSFGCFAVSFLGLALHPPLLAGIAIDGLGEFAGGLAYTAVLAWAVGSFPGRYRARGIGIWSSSFYLGSFLSAILLEWITGRTADFLLSLGSIGAIYGVLALILSAQRILINRRASIPKAG